MKEDFYGVLPPVVTPFTSDGKNIAEDNLRKVMRHVVSNGCTGVFVGGSQGEFFSMSFDERVRTYEIAADEAGGKYPVIAGTAAITTDETVALSKAAAKAGLSSVSVINPYFITLNEDELFDHYRSLAESVDIPVFLYNNPGRTGSVIPVSVIIRLSTIENIVGMKDSSGDLTYVNSILDNTENFSVFCGRDTCIYNELTSGAVGAVAATANVAPALVSSIYNLVQEGDLEGARKAQAQLAPLRDAFSLGSFPVVVKEALELIGVKAGAARLPIQPMTDSNRAKLKSILETMGLTA
ncbi:MAG: 4-hydroxy-tetrahydrodipicolinate synthase [Spirochaetales bacterium]|nr:4-hydroxy-tetrahydrodipicolinate synthase [Spirochaetales bacterium]